MLLQLLYYYYTTTTIEVSIVSDSRSRAAAVGRLGTSALKNARQCRPPVRLPSGAGSGSLCSCCVARPAVVRRGSVGSAPPRSKMRVGADRPSPCRVLGCAAFCVLVNGTCSQSAAFSLAHTNLCLCASRTPHKGTEQQRAGVVFATCCNQVWSSGFRAVVPTAESSTG